MTTTVAEFPSLDPRTGKLRPKHVPLSEDAASTEDLEKFQSLVDLIDGVFWAGPGQPTEVWIQSVRASGKTPLWLAQVKKGDHVRNPRLNVNHELLIDVVSSDPLYATESILTVNVGNVRGGRGEPGMPGRDGRDSVGVVPTDEALASYVSYYGGPFNSELSRETQRVTSKKVPQKNLDFGLIIDRPIIPLDIGTDGLVYGAMRNGTNRAVRSGNGFSTVENGPLFSDMGENRIIRTVTRTAEGYYAVLSGSTWGSDFSTVWFSTNWSSGWVKVQEMRHVLQISISRPVTTPTGTVILLGEYGNGDVRRLYLSRNGGQSWSVIYTHNRKLGVTATNNHIHHAMYDKDTGKIWLSAGDGLNSYMGWSSDWGVTWNDVPARLPLVDNPGATYRQPTILTPTSSRIISTPDGGIGKTGIWDMDKKYGEASVSYEAADTPPFRSYPLHPWVQSGDKVYILFPPIPSVGFEDHIYIAGTADGGQSWHNIYKQYAPKWEWEYIEGIVGPDKDGRIFLYGEKDGAPNLFISQDIEWRPETANTLSEETKSVTSAVTKAAELTEAVKHRGVWNAGDTFDRPDSPQLGYTPMGLPWVNLGTTNGRWIIQSGVAQPAASSQNARSFLPLDSSDYYVEVELVDSNIADSEFWLVIRGRDENYYYRFGRLNPTTLALQKVNGGTVTALWTTNQRDLNKTGTLGIRAQGEFLTVYLDGAALNRVSDGSIKGTLTGIQAFSESRKVASITSKRIGPSPWAGSWVASDTFNRAGAADSPGVSDTGQTWSTPSGRSAWRVFAGKLRPVADSNSVAFLDLGTSSHITTFDLGHTLGAYEFWCLFDVVSLDNMYRFGRLNATTLAFQKVESGTVSTLWTKTGYNMSSPVRLSVGRAGNRIHLFNNGGRIHSGTDSSFSTSTIGIQAFTTLAALNSLSSRSYI